MQKTIHPIVKWAQRKDRVLITVEVQDLKDEKVDLKENSIEFSARDDENNYTFKFEFYKEINIEESKQHNYTLNYRFILVKKDKEGGYWPRLTKESGKTQWIQVDWGKYVDEDDEEEEGHKGLDDWNQDQFQNFGGQQNGGEDEEEDEDDQGEQKGDELDKEEDEDDQGEQKGDELDKEEEIGDKPQEQQQQ